MAQVANLRRTDQAALIDLDGPTTAIPSAQAEAAPINWSVVRMQFHGTWSHSDDPQRKLPEDMSKEDFGELLLRLADKVFHRSSEARRARLNKLTQCAVFGELHA